VRPTPPATAPLDWGDHAPWFAAAALSGSPTYSFDTVAGRHVLMLFHGSAARPGCAEALQLVAEHRALFDDHAACFFGVSVDPDDVRGGHIAQQIPGIRFFLDFERKLSTLYGAAGPGDEHRPHWLVLDPALRVIGRFDLDRGAEAIALVRARADADAGDGWAPVLRIPDVIEPALCRRLIDLYEAHGGDESGFMRDVDGKTVAVTDPAHKRRKDYTIEDPNIVKAARARFIRRVVPQIRKAHQYEVTRMERYLVACYAAEDEAHFRAHRDNTTKGTAHRRFAVSVNLNDAFDGGEVSFPEYGPHGFKPLPGGAVVFSCSLLHAVSKITGGRRYAFLPFIYDDEAAKIREANNQFLGEGVGAYKTT